MNVGRAERTLVYEDYKPPVFHMTGSLCYAAGETVDVSSKIIADSVLDGDLTSNIKYSLEKTVNTQAAGEYPIEFRVMDSGGNTVYLKTQISISDKSYAGIDVKLKDYLIYLSVGDAFDPNAYFDSADKEGELTVQSNVNTAKAGSYYVDYIVNAKCNQWKKQTGRSCTVEEAGKRIEKRWRRKYRKNRSRICIM